MGQNFFVQLPPSSGGGDITAAYLLVSGSDPQGSLINFRKIAAQGVISLIDQGVGQSLIISASGIVGPQGSTGAAGGADPGASYVVVSTTGSLPNDRQLTAGGGIALTDGGAGGSLTITNIANTPILTGSIFGNSAASIAVVSTNTVITTQSVLLISTSVGPLNMTLPPSTLGRTIIMKDVSGQATTNPFTAYPTANNTIDTASSSYAFNINFGVLRLIGDGGGWYTW